MNRLGQLGGGPRDADPAFRGLDCYAPAELLEPGWYVYGENVRVENGHVSTRRGLSWVLGSGDLGVEWDIEWDVVWDSPTDRRVFALAPWRDPRGAEYTARVFRDEVRLSRSGRADVILSFPDGEFVTRPARLVQAYDHLILLRGKGELPLLWDGDAGANFAAYPGANVAEAFDGIYWQGRLWLLFGRDGAQFSDVLSNDFAAFSELNLNRGSSDNLVRLWPLNQRTLIAFKERSILGLLNVFGDPAANAQLVVVSGSRGCVAPDSVADVGPDVFFLSEGGVFGLSMVDESRATVRDVPVSRPIQPVIDRINWSAAVGAKGVYWRNRYYLAVPLDGARVNNAVLVFNVLLGAWESVDTFPTVADMAVDGWVTMEYQGETRLAVLHQRGYLMLYEQNPMIDENPLFSPEFPGEGQMRTVLRSRLYRAGSPERKHFTMARATVRTVNPMLTLDVLTPGVREARRSAVDALTRSAQRFAAAGMAPTAPDNSDGKFMLPFREDYFVDPAAGDFYLGDGVEVQAMQHWTLPVPIRRAAEGVQVEIRSDTGRLSVEMIEVSAAPMPTPRVSV